MSFAKLYLMSIDPSSLMVKGASQEVLSAIKQASHKTGVDFSYLVNQARTESSFRPDVKASTSSATGLYQFIDQTWLATVSKHGSKHGLHDEVSKIERDFQGRYFVADDADKVSIMNLRKDPQIASLMAAEFASDNQQFLEKRLGRKTTPTDLYFAHFLGAGGASKFLKAMQNDPLQSGANLLKSAANANKNIFYNSDGSHKNLNQIYKNFEAKFAGVQVDQDVPNEPIESAQRTYRPDPSFSKFYSQPVDNFVAKLPSLPALQQGDFFSSLFGNSQAQRMQNQIIDPLSFLMLTELDVPK